MAQGLGVDEVVGRQGEIEVLAAFIDEPPPAAPLLLEGEPGIGKTTLWRSAIDAAQRRSYLVLTCGPTQAESHLTFSALGDLLKDALPLVADRLPPPQRRALEIALLLADDEGIPQEQRAIALGVINTLRELATSHPVLLAMDDLQWMDASSAAVMDFALRRLDDIAVKVIATRRIEPNQVASRLKVLSSHDLRRLRVAPLSLGAMHRLIHLRLNVVFPRPLLRRIHEASAGNPLYGLEIARLVAGGSGRAQPGPAVTVPEDFDSVIAAKVEAVSEPAQAVLEVVSAQPSPTVAMVETALAGEATLEHLDEAMHAGLLEVDEEVIRFSHPLFAAVVYNRLTPGRRRALHRRLAAIATSDEDRARHLALGSSGPNGAVAEALDEAALAACRRGAPDTGAELAELAIRLTQPSTSIQLVDRYLAAARYHGMAGDARRACSMLKDLIAQLAPGPRRARVLVSLAIEQEYVPDGERLCLQALEEATDDDATLAEAHHALAEHYLIVGNITGALDHGRASCRLAESSGQSTVFRMRAMAFVSLVETCAGQVTPGLLERAVEMEQSVLEAPDQRLPPDNYGPTVTMGMRLMFRGRLDEGRALLETARARAARRGDVAALTTCLLHRSELEWRAGDWPRALDLAEQSDELMQQLGKEQGHTATAYVTALTQAHLGRLEDARTSARAGIACSESVGDELFRLENLGVLGFIELSADDPVAALEHLRPVVSQLDSMGYYDPGIFPLVLPTTIEALIALGDLDAAAPLVAEFEKRARRLGSEWALGSSERCRALMEAARGNLEAGAAACDRALSHHERIPMPFERARTLLVLGGIRRRTRAKRAAREALAAALEVFEELGAPIWAQRARVELGRIGGRAPASDALTPAEEQVAALVAKGLSNREVARTLFVSDRTVEAHLSRIYAKLGVRSRAQLSAKLERGRPQAAARPEQRSGVSPIS